MPLNCRQDVIKMQIVVITGDRDCVWFTTLPCLHVCPFCSLSLVKGGTSPVKGQKTPNEGIHGWRKLHWSYLLVAHHSKKTKVRESERESFSSECKIALLRRACQICNVHHTKESLMLAYHSEARALFDSVVNFNQKCSVKLQTEKKHKQAVTVII